MLLEVTLTLTPSLEGSTKNYTDCRLLSLLAVLQKESNIIELGKEELACNPVLCDASERRPCASLMADSGPTER